MTGFLDLGRVYIALSLVQRIGPTAFRMARPARRRPC